MKFGFILPNNWGMDDPHDVIGIAVKAESLGFNSVWVSHHIINAGYVLDRLEGRSFYDALTTLTYVAAKTERIRLGTSVIVLPWTNPLGLAKSLATLDVLSGGRVDAGIGEGALKAESDALGSDYATRRAFTDEGINIMRTLWTQEDASYEGQFFQFKDVKFAPKPTQKPQIPIWIGGQSTPAMRRVARYGDGWHPQWMSPTELASRLQDLKVHMDEAGRDVSALPISLRLDFEVLEQPSSDVAEQMVGTPEQLLEAIQGYTEVGVDEIDLQIGSRDPAKFHSNMEKFADKVMSKI